MIRYQAAAATDTGVQRICNQDSFGAKILQTVQGEIAAAIMCDGMGGYDSGEVASATVVDAFQRWILRRLPLHCENGLDKEAVLADWCGLLELCNRRIMRYGATHGVKLGTTAAMLLMTQEEYLILNVGDCRIYEIGEQIEQLTIDHTIIAQEVAAGILTPEEAETDPRGHILSECIGISPEMHPDAFHGKVKPETVFLLCCDGFRHMVKPADMLEAMHPENVRDCVQMREQLQGLVGLNIERGETDNISAVAIRTQAGESTEAQGEFEVLQEFCYTDTKELATED